MAKINGWLKKEDKLANKQKVKDDENRRVKYKGKSISSMSQNEKDELLEIVAKQLNLL